MPQLPRWTAALLPWVVALPVQAGVIMETSLRTPADGAAPRVDRSYFQDGKFRLQVGGDAAHNITLFKDQTLYEIDRQDKSYRAIDQATLAQLGNQLASARAALEARMALMPPAQRAIMEKMLTDVRQHTAGGKEEQSEDFHATGHSDQVAGRRCRIWEQRRKGELKVQLCVVTPESLPGGTQMTQVLQSVGDFMQALRRALASSAIGDPTRYWTDLQKINGFPLRVREFSDGKPTFEQVVISIREQALPATRFEIPVDYHPKKLDLAGG